MEQINTEIIQDTGYGLIPRRVMRDEHLSTTAKCIYCYLASFAGNTGKSFPSTSLMAKELNISNDTLFKYLKELKTKNVITIKKEKSLDSKFTKNIYYLHNKVNEETPYPKSSDTTSSDTTSSDTRNQDTNSNNLNSNNLNSNNNKEYSSAKANPQIPFKEIVEYLNEKTEKNYSYKAKGNRTLIRARWNENYTLKDFKKVIDIKTEQWKDDPKMKQYLRPSTLFNSKFDNYLNEEMKEDANKASNAGDGYWEVL